MKLPAYSLIEGVVSMVILSITLGMVGLITSNLLNSMPNGQEFHQTGRYVLHADSLTDTGILRENRSYREGILTFSFKDEPSPRFDSLLIRRYEVRDTGRLYVSWAKYIRLEK